MLTIAALMMGLAVPQSEPPVPKGAKTYTLRVPDEIDASMEPYVDCRLQSLGAHTYDKNGQPKPKKVDKGGDCTTYREQSVAASDEILRGLGRSESDRKVILADTLTMIDDFIGSMSGLPIK